MSKLKEWFKADKRRIGSVVIYALIILYVVYCAWFSCSKAYASDLVSDGFIAEEQVITLENGMDITLYPNNVHTDLEYCVIVYNDNSDYYSVFYSNQSFYTNDDGTTLYNRSGSSTCQHNGGININDCSTIYMTIGITDTFCWSNHNILCGENGTEVFFMQAPITPLIRGTKLSGVKIVQLTLAGIGGVIVVCLISLVGFLALRKAWRFLVQNLRQA